MRRFSMVALVVSTLTSTAFAQIIVPGADGSDGAFNPTSNITIDLSLAPDGAWDGPNTSPGNGVYDDAKWAIVFRYSSVNIPAGVTVAFRPRNYAELPGKNGNPPVVWLVSGPVTIGGLLHMDPIGGADSAGFAISGPGGFRGSGTNYFTGGLGPGGHAGVGGGGAPEGQFASGRAYGNARNLPLIGGSGGGSPSSGQYGGRAGGALLLVSTGTMTLNGQIRSLGQPSASGNPGGSGGAIRLICNRLEGTGNIRTAQPAAYEGRIRIEANQFALGDIGQPVASFGLPGATAQLWPDDATDPSVRVVSLSSIPIPANPAARFDFPAADLNIETGSGQQLLIEAKNIPTGSDPPGVQAWNVRARVVPRGSTAFTVNATFSSGNYATSLWTATLSLPNGTSAVQVRASIPPQ